MHAQFKFDQNKDKVEFYQKNLTTLSTLPLPVGRSPLKFDNSHNNYTIFDHGQRFFQETWQFQIKIGLKIGSVEVYQIYFTSPTLSKMTKYS